MMKKITFILITFFITFNVAFAQEPGQEDLLTLSQIDENTKNKRFERIKGLMKLTNI